MKIMKHGFRGALRTLLAAMLLALATDLQSAPVAPQELPLVPISQDPAEFAAYYPTFERIDASNRRRISAARSAAAVNSPDGTRQFVVDSLTDPTTPYDAVRAEIIILEKSEQMAAVPVKGFKSLSVDWVTDEILKITLWPGAGSRFRIVELRNVASGVVVFRSTTRFSPPPEGTAKSDTAAMSIKNAALAALLNHPDAARSNAVVTRRLILDPIILQLWYDNGIQRESSAPVIRDSAQSVALANTLATSLASGAEIAACTPPASPANAEQCKLLDVIIVSIAEPRPAGREVSLLMRTIAPVRLANGSVTLSRYGSLYLVRLTNADGTWRVRCLTNVPTDSPANPTSIAARCGPP